MTKADIEKKKIRMSESDGARTNRRTKKDLDKIKSLARTLYLSGMEQQEIAEKVDVSRVTISKWCSADGWKEARAAKNITRPELVNKLLLTIDTLITQVNNSNDPALIAGLGDKLAKLSSVIEKLDKKANVVDAIEVFMAFSKWLEYRSQTDPDVTPELMRVIVNNQLIPRMVKHGFPIKGLRFEWDDAVDYTPEQQVAYETMIADRYDVDSSYFAEKYSMPVGERRNAQPMLPTGGDNNDGGDDGNSEPQDDKKKQQQNAHGSFFD